MRETMEGQAEALAALVADPGPAERAADRLRGRRVLIVGTGTSWHAAEQGARLLRLAGADAAAAQSADAALDPGALEPVGAVVALTHTGAKRYTGELVGRARAGGIEVVQVSGHGVQGTDVATVAQERSSAYTASHLGALVRLAQIAVALGAPLGRLDEVPSAVQDEFETARPAAGVPERLIEFVGGGINQWTAAEGALKIREAAYVASEGLAAEQFLHGPAVAMQATDRLVCLDGGGPWSPRVGEIADAAERSGVPVTRLGDQRLGEPLSIFPLTVAVHRIALESAEALGTDPDTFGRDVPGREPWDAISL